MTKLEKTPKAPKRRRSYLRGGLSRGLVGFSVSSRQRCPFCHDGLGEGEDLVACSACRAVYHRECLGPMGECLTFGCPNAADPVGDPPSRGRWGRRLVALGLVITGIALVWLFVSPPHPYPIEPPGCPPPPPLPAITATVSQPLHGLRVLQGQAVPVRGRLHLGFAGQSYPRSIPVLVNGRHTDSAPVLRDLGFACNLRLPVGTHEVELHLPNRIHRARVQVQAAARPVSDVVPQLDLVGTVSGSEVMVRGRLKGRGAVKFTIRGGGQSFTYDARAPCPFATVLTLPTVGTHRIEVSVRDAWGNVRKAVGTVRRLR